jgi:hypothetical protein
MGRAWHVTLLCSALAVAFAPAPRAQPKAQKGAAQKPSDRWKPVLESGSEAEKLSVLGEIGQASGAGAAPAAALVNELLVRGASVAVVESTLEVAGRLAQRSSSAAVAPYVRHRAPSLRRAATRALGKTGGPEAIAALRGALRGSDASLRGSAASGLAALGAKEAVPDLFAVLIHPQGGCGCGQGDAACAARCAADEKPVPEAAAAIGKLCAPADCDKLSAELGKLPFDLMQAGLEPILLRPESEIPEQQKLSLLERLRKFQTREASAFLQTVRARYPANGSARIKLALDDAVNNRPVLDRPKKP